VWNRNNNIKKEEKKEQSGMLIYNTRLQIKKAFFGLIKIFEARTIEI